MLETEAQLKAQIKALLDKARRPREAAAASSVGSVSYNGHAWADAEGKTLLAEAPCVPPDAGRFAAGTPKDFAVATASHGDQALKPTT
jgi:hypothetical protein